MDTTMNNEYTPETTVGEMRKRYGRHFAEGHEDQETLGKVLALAGTDSLEEYLRRLPKSA